MRPYGEYRISGVPWVGEVPAHWKVPRLKQVCIRSALYGANIAASSYTASGVRFLRTTDITEDGFLRPGGVHLPPQLVQDYTLDDGDILISRSGTVGRAFLYREAIHGPCSYAGYLVRFVPGTLANPKYLFFYTKTQSFREFLRVSSIQSTIENVNGEKYANASLPLPPAQEQDAIVRFLDHHDQSVNRLIHAKRRLIALLTEQKQAVIHQAVTRGLDPAAPLKPSGVDWLGEVPAHWDVRKIKQLSRFDNGIAFKPSDWGSDGVPIIRIQNLNGSESLNYTTRTDLPERLLIKPGDLLFAWSGNRGTSFGPFLWDRSFPAYLNQHIFKMRDYKLNESYFYYQLKAVTRHVEENTQGIIGLVHITKPELGSIMVPVPPVEEQKAIAHRLRSELGEIDRSISTIRREIDLIREYRTRLIADVVTGKVDVRHLAADLPPVDAEDVAPPVEVDGLLDEGDGIDDLDALIEEEGNAAD